MKTVNKLILLASASVVMFSCTKEAMNEVDQNKFKAEVATTKISIDNDFATAWELGDKVTVYDGAKAYTFTAEKAGMSTTLATDEEFSMDPAGTYTATYPAIDGKNFAADGVTINVPAIQHLSQNPFDFTYCVARTTGSQKTFNFINVASIVSFEITESNVNNVALEAIGAEDMTGTVKVDPASGSSTIVSGTDGKSLILASDGTFATGRYYAAILPQTYSEGIRITITKEDGSRTQRKIKAFTLPRSSYIDLDKFDASRTWDANFSIKSASEFQAFLLAAAGCTADAQVSLEADIDLTGVNIEPAVSFAGTLDGAGHSIKGMNTNMPLFKTLTGTVRNLVIDETSNYNIRIGKKGDTENIANDAFIAGVNKGVVENCVNNAPMTREGTSNFAQSRAIAAIAAVNEGTVKNCINNGAITISAGGFYQLDQWIGGVVGRTAPESEEAVSVEGCTNNGAITYTVAKNKSANFIGGVIGGTAANVANGLYSMAGLGNYGTIKGCTNNGDICVNFTENVKDMVNLNLGGVVGYAEASLENCRNAAKSLSYTSPIEGSYPLGHASVGGVAGFVLYSMTDCKNEAQVNIQGMFKGTGTALTAGSGYYTACFFGGVAGAAGPNTGENACTNCDNSGAIIVKAYQTSSDTARHFFGGIVGYGKAPLTDCDNSGKLEFISDSQYKFAGGIAGQSSYGVTKCNNTGDLTVDAVIAAADGNKSNKGFYIGGVSGIHVPATNHKLEQCNNAGNILVENGGCSTDINYVGGLVGYSLGEVHGKDASNFCLNSGNIDIRNNGKYYLGGIAGTISYKILYARNEGNITMKGINGGGIVGKSLIGGIAGVAQYKLSYCIDGSEDAHDYGVGNNKAGYVCSNTGDVTVKEANACGVSLCFGKMNGTGGKTVGALKTACQWHTSVVSGTLTVTGAQTNVGVIAGEGAPGGIICGMNDSAKVTFKDIVVNGTSITKDNLQSYMGNGMVAGTNVALSYVAYE